MHPALIFLRRIRDNPYITILLAVLIIGAYSAWINFSTLNVVDPDGYYHIRHAWLYRTEGIFSTSFPWTQFSVIKEKGADLWYGFHILLIPFTYFKDLILGIKYAAFVITWVSLVLYFLAFYRLKLRLPLFWPMFLPFANLFMMARFSVTRPHPLSIGLNMLLFSFIVQGGHWPVFFISFLLAFIHFNLFWIPILTFIIINIALFLNKKGFEYKKGAALLGGILAGLLLKPNPIGALELNYIQLVDISLVKFRQIGLNFGKELYPLSISGIPTHLLILTAASAVFFVWLAYKRHLAKADLPKKIEMWTLLLLTMMFLLMSFSMAIRAVDFFMSYFLLFIAYEVTFYSENILNKDKSSGFKKTDLLWGIAMSGIIIYLVLFNLYFLGDYRRSLEDDLPDPYRFQSSSGWLELNTKPGDIVFHLGWDTFPELFFWNQKNFYINGMDPIFMYVYNPALYWEYHFLAVGQGAEFTCNQRKCDKTQIVETYDAIKNDFKAKYILVWPPTHRKFFEYLEKNPDKFERVYVGRSDVVYRVL